MIVVVSYINIFPEGYIFSGGDVVQYFNFEKILNDFNLTWSNQVGEGHFLQYFSYNLFYFFLFIVSHTFNIGASGQSFFYYFIFLSGSFWSFYITISFFKRTTEERYKTIFSLLYTFNMFTFYNFYYTWGFSPFLFLYILLPLILGTTYKYFSITDKIRFDILGKSVVVFFLLNISNGNLPFFISLSIILFLFIVLFIAFHYKSSDLKHWLQKTAIYFSFMFLCSFWSITPQIIEMIRLIKVFDEGQAFFDLKHWLLWQSLEIQNVFFNIPDIKHYIENISILTLFSITLFLATIGSLFAKKLKTVPLIFLILLLFVIFLINKGKGIISDEMVWSFFNNPILLSIKSYDKTLIFLPCILLLLLFLNIKDDLNKYTKYLYILLLLNSLSVFPLFFGEVQQKYSVAFNKNEDFKTAKYSYIHSIPKEYYEISLQNNTKLLDYKIFSIPYSVINSSGWINFPKWKVVGSDPTIQLFKHPVVQMNAFSSFGNWNYGEHWNSQNKYESRWLFPFMGLLNVKYMIYHKDIDVNFIDKTIEKIEFYEKEKLLKEINENEYFIFFEINDKYFLPKFYVPEKIIISDQENKDLPDILQYEQINRKTAIYFKKQNKGKGKISEYNFSTTPVIEFKKILATKYRIRIHGAKENFPLVFSDTFHGGWKVYVNNIGDTKNSTRFQNYYKPESNNENYQAKIEDVKKYVNEGLISTLGDGSKKRRKFYKWQNSKKIIDHQEDYYIDFISKNNKNVIQNNNLPSGSYHESWFKKQISNNENHLKVNGFANSWIINIEDIKKTKHYNQNKDGSIDFELLIEFWPQRIYFTALFVSSAVVLVSLIYLLVNTVKVDT
jgi:hypothetical protein